MAPNGDGAAAPENAAVAEKKEFTLKSMDGELFVVEEAWVKQSKLISNVIEMCTAGFFIPVPKVDASTLELVIKYCRKHAELATDPDPDGEELEEFDAKFVKVDHEILFDLIEAAHYLDIKSLLELTCKEVANMMKGKSVDEIRTHFHIVNDYTLEEEEKVRMENAWAFECDEPWKGNTIYAWTFERDDPWKGNTIFG